MNYFTDQLTIDTDILTEKVDLFIDRYNATYEIHMLLESFDDSHINTNDIYMEGFKKNITEKIAEHLDWMRLHWFSPKDEKQKKITQFIKQIKDNVEIDMKQDPNHVYRTYHEIYDIIYGKYLKSFEDMLGLSKTINELLDNDIPQGKFDVKDSWKLMKEFEQLAYKFEKVSDILQRKMYRKNVYDKITKKENGNANNAAMLNVCLKCVSGIRQMCSKLAPEAMIKNPKLSTLWKVWIKDPKAADFNAAYAGGIRVGINNSIAHY